MKEINKKNNINAPVWSLTESQRFIETEKKWKEKVSSKNTVNYKLVLPWHFAYSPSSFNFNNSEKVWWISQIYTVFKIIDETKIKTQYLFSLFQSKQFIK